jgi:hypothetical protein
MVVALVALSAGPAFAAAPYRKSWTNQPGSTTLPASSVCSFPITVNYVSSGTYTQWNYADGSGMAIWHSSEQDTFIANGVTLTGDKYTDNGHQTWDSSGTITTSVLTGGIEEINLPDGSRFWSAGRDDDFGATPGISTPDHGLTGNFAALCAVLS